MFSWPMIIGVFEGGVGSGPFVPVRILFAPA